MLDKRIILALGMFVILVMVAAQTTDPAAPTVGSIRSSYDDMPNDGFVASETITTWHHDCSNLTAFDGIGDNTWPHDSVVTVTFGTISCSGTYFYSNDVGTGTGHHGPLLYHTLETPFKLSQFHKLQAEIEIDAAFADRRGWIRVGLHAPDNATILTLQIADPWIGTSNAYAQLLYKYTNGTIMETSQSSPDYTNPEPCHETFAIVYNASGLCTSFPGITNSCLLTVPQVESSRVVKYISIQFNGYDDGVLCETMRIHDLVVDFADEESKIPTFPYRMYHTIMGSPGAGTNYQVEIKVHSGEGTNIGNQVNLPSALWTPTDPVRFTDDDGVTLLDYWKEWSDEDDAIYWVEVRDNLDYDTGIFLYFGNSSEPDRSNGTDTFLFFDDFENGNLNRWDYVGSQWNITTSDKRYGSYSAHYDGLVHSDFLISNLTSSQSGIMIHSWYKPENTIRGGKIVFYTSINGRKEAVTSHDSYWQYWDGSVYTKYSDSVIISSPPQWNRVELGVNLANYEMMLWVNRTYIGAASHIYDDDGNNITQSETIYRIEVSNQLDYEHWADDYYVRKWIETEPVHGGWYDDVPPTIDSPSDIQYNEFSSGHLITWAPYDFHPLSYAIYLEGTLSKAGTWNSSSETITISVDGLGLGTYNYTITVSDEGGNTATDTVFVTVIDGTAPNIDTPIDLQYDEFDAGNALTWTPSDAHPASYVIYLDGSIIRSGAWNSSLETISISVDGHGLGVYNYTLMVTDIGGNAVADEVLVTVVDATSPTIDSPVDVEYPEFSTGYSIVWSPADANPLSYVIYLDGSIIRSGAWNSSLETISISVDGLGLGTHNYTLVVTDMDNNNGMDQVLVTVIDGTPPSIDAQTDIQYYELTIGNSITWTQSDAHPASYIIYLDGVPAMSGAWNSSSESISISVDGLGLGTYNYTLLVTDVGGNTALDVVMVVVMDGTLPTLDTPLDIQYEEVTTGHNITWHPSDLHPASYVIYLDGLPIKSGVWNSSSESIAVSIDDLSLGIFNYTLVVTDIGGNVAQDSVMVTVVDTTNPTIDSPSDIQYEEFALGYSITWHPYDMHPSNYVIYMNDNPVMSGAWNSSEEVFTISVDGLNPGTYIFMIEVTDTSGNSIVDSVIVTVVEATTSSTTTTTTTGTTAEQPDFLLIIAVGAGGTIIIVIIVIIMSSKRVRYGK